MLVITTYAILLLPTCQTSTTHQLPLRHRRIVMNKIIMSFANTQCRPYYQHYFGFTHLLVVQWAPVPPLVPSREKIPLTSDPISQKRFSGIELLGALFFLGREFFHVCLTCCNNPLSGEATTNLCIPKNANPQLGPV